MQIVKGYRKFLKASTRTCKVGLFLISRMRLIEAKVAVGLKLITAENWQYVNAIIHDTMFLSYIESSVSESKKDICMWYKCYIIISEIYIYSTEVDHLCKEDVKILTYVRGCLLHNTGWREHKYYK